MHAPRPLPILAGSYTGPSRRLQPRNRLHWPVAIQVVGGTERQGMTVDLSQEGLSLSTDRPISPGSRCSLQLQLPGEPEPLLVHVKAVYSSYRAPGDFRIGMVFLPEEGRSTARLRALAAAQA